MEFLATHTERYQQLALLKEQLIDRYLELESSYQKQKQEMVEYKHKAHYWETQFSRLKTREATLKQEVEALKAQLRQREQQLFGNQSEQTSKKQGAVTNTSKQTPRQRGQQPGQAGQGRRDYSHLPSVDELVSIDAAYCPCCKLPYEELPGTKNSEILETINVKAYRRCIQRKVYKRHCRCKNNPDAQLLSAPTTERLLPKSNLGISIWALLLVNKYSYQQPLQRTLEQLIGCCDVYDF